MGTLFPSRWNRIITEELNFRCMKTAFAQPFLTKNSMDSEVIYTLRKIFQVPNDQHFVNIANAKISYNNRGKGLVTMC